jgi:hypothetical protein
VSDREEPKPYVHADVAVGEVLESYVCGVVAVGGAFEPGRSTAVEAAGTLLMSPCFRRGLRTRSGQKEPEPRNRTEITENRNRTNRTEGTVMKFGYGFLRTEINEIFSVLHSKEPKEPKEPKTPKVLDSICYMCL